ncbi:hypothetical protein SAMN04489722_104173 [Algibacter lectus]|uniref:hypothetical protein n=1 Tax=Algibacter lectus TaxID=221126 RepID=UPI0008E68F21|nr:hypothetical protein [Algibacter lectus]SFC96484.1 hypothetical protein SAMN04489722_104173 [Algibacter lectus]
MKKIIYYLLVLGVVFTGCNPLEDITDDIQERDIEGVDFIKGVEQYTFTDEDYEIYEGELDSIAYFLNQDLADLVIPDFLANKYPVWGEGSLVNVGYNLYSPTLLETMSTTETLAGLSGIEGYLSSNYETALNGTFVELTYNAEVLAYELSSADFETIGAALADKYPNPADNAASYGNFGRWDSSSSYWSDDMILEAMDALLAGKYAAGQVVSVSFATYGPSSSESVTLQYNGSKFINLNVEVTAATGTEYTLSSTDIDDIAAALAVTYSGPAENLGTFYSFDVRSTSDNYWSQEMILEGLNLVLPATTEGGLYVVTYAIYNGSATTQVLTLKYESGEYVVNPATITEVTTIVAKNNGDWEFPYVFSSADYDLLGESYGNFDSGSIYKLEIFLESLYPYAQAGDVSTVQYRYYSSGATTTKYGSSVFDGDKWALPQDIIETSFQYGFEDGQWVPDNTINYSLLAADITLISTALIEDYPEPADNLGFFKSFDRRDTSDTYWDDETLLEALNVLLNARDSGAEEGQKYAVSYVAYTGATVTETQYVVKTDGVWVYQ